MTASSACVGSANQSSLVCIVVSCSSISLIVSRLMVLRISCSSSALVGMFIIVFGMCISVLIVLSLCCWLLGYSRPSVRLACSAFGLSFSGSCRRVWSSCCSVGVWCVSIFVMFVMFAWVRCCVMLFMASVVVVVWVVIPISVCGFGDS